ncbi:TadE/TadG family type IV pilus assembly protein [Sphingomonas sp. PR090111-T3T-6A]|uniref:TadE/TadG family type IV pilus assembly protein n=1 Tax=Sphingomonas sp. PR090111-T3T-6A TaxID=685778 RepID=UPI00037FB8E6|nr:TadE/TadG family type IV pilus assembly protein [Sphingomonas sp. PR090111-T3T-6A]
MSLGTVYKRRPAKAAAWSWRSDAGVTAIEFALAAPVLFLLLFGLFDALFNLYMVSTLQGVVQKAARDSTLQDYSTPTGQATLDAAVTAQVHRLLPSANVPTPTRQSFHTYADAAAQKAEPWTDTDHDGTCDNGEPYTDLNSNGSWDSNGANTGSGGAKDRTIYTVTVTYPRLFPLAKMIGLSSTVTLKATTVLENQPYADQNLVGTKILNCS